MEISARLGKAEEADRWMNASLERAPKNPIVLYNGACYFALKSESVKAMDTLESCLFKVGSINRPWLENDSDLDNIRGHPRFARIVESLP